MTHQRNLILPAAIAAAFGFAAVSAHAGVGSALPAKIATASLVSDTVVFTGNQVTYSTQVPLSTATIYYLYAKLTNVGKFSAAPAAPSAVFSSANGALQKAISGGTVALSTDKTFLVVTMAATTVVIPVNQTVSFTPSAAAASGGVNTLTSLLSGGAVNVQISFGSSASATTALADIDSAAGGNMITFTPSQTFFSCSSGSSTCQSSLNIGVVGAETAQIDVAGGTGVNLTQTAGGAAPVWTGNKQALNFGGFKFTNVAGVLTPDQTSSWSIAQFYTAGALGATVTGNFAAATSMFLSTDPACAASSFGDLTLNTAKTTASLTGGGMTATGNGLGVCMVTNGTTQVAPTTPTLVTSLSTSTGALFAGASLTFPASGTASLYPLLPNGGTATVRAYIPAAATGYSDTVRIINIGQVAATVSVARIDPVTGVTGTSAVLPGGAIAAGGAMNYSNTTIETALGGAFASGDRPRLLFTANTSIEAQNYIINPNGTLTTLHSKD